MVPWLRKYEILQITEVWVNHWSSWVLHAMQPVRWENSLAQGERGNARRVDWLSYNLKYSKYYLHGLPDHGCSIRHFESKPHLGGGFKYFLFSPLPGEMIQFWNHQLAIDLLLLRYFLPFAPRFKALWMWPVHFTLYFLEVTARQWLAGTMIMDNAPFLV